MAIQSVNPTTSEVLETFDEHSRQDVERILAAAHAAFLEWRDTRYAARAQSMRQAATTLRPPQADYPPPMTLQMGKTLVPGEAEGGECAWAWRTYAGPAE